MDIKTKISTIGEIRVIEEFIRKGFFVFSQINGKAPYDLVVDVDGILKKVSVKSVVKQTDWGVYKVQLRRIRSNKTKNKIYSFDPNDVDILGVYLHDINKVLLIESKSVTQTNMLTIKLDDLNVKTI